MEAQRQSHRIDIYEQDITMTIFENNTESRFVVTPDQLGLFFAPRTIFIPEEGLVWEVRENGARKVLFTYPMSKTPVTIYQSTPGPKGKSKMRRYRLLFPAMAIRASISSCGDKASVSKLDCWCMDTNTLKPGTNLFEVPLPNCNTSSICLGNIEKSIEGSTRDSLWKVLFDTVFSHHRQTVGKENIPFPKFAEAHKGNRISTKELNKIGKGSDIIRPKQDH